MTDHYVERPVVQQEPFIMLCGLGYDGFTVAQSDTWGKHMISDGLSNLAVKVRCAGDQ